MFETFSGHCCYNGYRDGYFHKAMHLYLSHANGEFSQAVTTQEEEFATLSMHASKDPSEGNFATFTDILCSGG